MLFHAVIPGTWEVDGRGRRSSVSWRPARSVQRHCLKTSTLVIKYKVNKMGLEEPFKKQGWREPMRIILEDFAFLQGGCMLVLSSRTAR